MARTASGKGKNVRGNCGRGKQRKSPPVTSQLDSSWGKVHGRKYASQIINEAAHTYYLGISTSVRQLNAEWEEEIK